MTDALYNIMNAAMDIMSVVMAVFEGFCTYELFRVFADTKSGRRFSEYAIGVFWAALNIGCYFALNNGVYEPMLLVKLVIYTLGIVLFSVIWYKGGILQRILPALLFSAVRELVVQLTNCFTVVNGFIVDIFWAMADNGVVIPYEMFPELTAAATTAVIGVITFLRVFIIFRIVRRIAKICRIRPQPGRETILYLLPSAVGIMICAMLRLILISVEGGYYTVLIYTRYPLLYIIVPIMSSLLLAAIVYSLKLHQDIAELRRAQADKAVLQNQLANMQSALAEKERLYESFRAVRHDMRNSVAALRGLISRRFPDDEEINGYFDSMNASFGQTESRVRTGSAVCDAVIGGKFGAAESAVPGIKLDADGFVFTDDISADPYDIGLILSNGLDNAAEACARLRESSPEAQAFITVRSFRQRNMFFIEIENSFDGVLRTDKNSGLPLSSKEGGLHGIGLRSVRACAEKYSGGMEFIVENGRFTLSVMLKAGSAR